jgi:hypothetical protein
MNALNLRPARDIRAPMDDLIATHGLFCVAAALMRAAIRRQRRRPPPIAELDDHLRRDIGLNPQRTDPRDGGLF